MAQNTTVSCPARQWTQITNADATAVTFLVNSGGSVYVTATEDANAPTSDPAALASFRYDVGQGEENQTLADIWLGITPVRLWVWPELNGASVAVSHA